MYLIICDLYLTSIKNMAYSNNVRKKYIAVNLIKAENLLKWS